MSQDSSGNEVNCLDVWIDSWQWKGYSSSAMRWDWPWDPSGVLSKGYRGQSDRKV